MTDNELLENIADKLGDIVYYLHRADEKREINTENKRFAFVVMIGGCELTIETPADITIEQLVKQCDRIIADSPYHGCGICSYRKMFGTDYDDNPDLKIEYDDIQEVWGHWNNPICKIAEKD